MKCGKCGKREEFYWLLSSKPDAKPVCFDCAQEVCSKWNTWDFDNYSLPKLVFAPEPLVEAIEDANEP